MGKCLKGQSESESKDARYFCEKCNAASSKKDHLCKPEKVSDGSKIKRDKKEKKSKK